MNINIIKGIAKQTPVTLKFYTRTQIFLKGVIQQKATIVDGQKWFDETVCSLTLKENSPVSIVCLEDDEWYLLCYDHYLSMKSFELDVQDVSFLEQLDFVSAEKYNVRLKNHIQKSFLLAEVRIEKEIKKETVIRGNFTFFENPLVNESDEQFIAEDEDCCEEIEDNPLYHEEFRLLRIENEDGITYHDIFEEHYEWNRSIWMDEVDKEHVAKLEKTEKKQILHVLNGRLHIREANQYQVTFLYDENGEIVFLLFERQPNDQLFFGLKEDDKLYHFYEGNNVAEQLRL